MTGLVGPNHRDGAYSQSQYSETKNRYRDQNLDQCKTIMFLSLHSTNVKGTKDYEQTESRISTRPTVLTHTHLFADPLLS
jgi:hypothetical protein